VRSTKLVIVGAGIGGLTAGALLARRGFEVTILDRSTVPGGKMREVSVGGVRIDSGPTVLTMRWIFEEIFAEAGDSLEARLKLTPASVLARHAWTRSSPLDLYADIEQSYEAIGRFAGRGEAEGYRQFCEASRKIYRSLENPFLRSSRPTIASLVKDGARNPLDLWNIRPFATLWQELGRYFKDERLRQLFARYATYCGSSPFLAPATLMLIAHVEQQGVWLVEGGMYRLCTALAGLCNLNGATLRASADVQRVMVSRGQVAGVVLAGGEQIAADAVVFNGETAALAGGLLGAEAAASIDRHGEGQRSLSAVTWSMVAEAEGFPLARHTVFFSDNYAHEFKNLMGGRRLPSEPTVYVCAQDRTSEGARTAAGSERLFCLINAPPTGETGPLSELEVSRCNASLLTQLHRCGLTIAMSRAPITLTQPADFARLFPGSGGALYGRATHGWKASFERPRARTRLPGLYLAGGSVHPGAGLPMVALSGRHAAHCVMADLSSTGPSGPVAMRGGTSTVSAPMVRTRSR